LTRNQILFRATGSCHYHQSRAGFLEGFANLLTIANIVLGGSAFATMMSNAPSKVAPWVGLAIAVLNAYRFVVKPDQLASKHREWAARWTELLADVQATANPPAAKLKSWIKTQTKLNGESRGEMRALAAHCFNTTLGSLGIPDERYPLKWRHRTFKHIFKFTHAFDNMKFERSANSG
jgi:hypothetical protein